MKPDLSAPDALACLGGWQRAAPWLMLLAGAAHTAAFAPLNIWWLQIAALAALPVAVGSAASVARAALLGWCFAFGGLGSGLWWVYISMHDFGGLPAALAVVAVAALAAALALYAALAMALFAVLARRASGGCACPGVAWRGGVLFAACWLAAELARAQGFTGFAWLASGNAHTGGPLAALAPWVGVYGIGAAAALLAAVLAAVIRRCPGAWRLAVLALAAPLAAALAPADFTRGTGWLRVSLIQPNVAQDLKFDPARLLAQFDALKTQLHAAQGELVVTPETVVPLPLEYLDSAFWDDLTTPFRHAARAALIGVFLGNAVSGHVNSLVGVAPGQNPDYEYGKQHLLPFGEFIPRGFHWLLNLMHIPLGDQARGTNSQPFEVAGQRVRPLICYESLFGEDFAASAVGPRAATVYANASNLAWFGPFMVQDQHLQVSQMRALEFQRPFIHATNTGATAVVDARGRVAHRLAAQTAGTLEAQVEGRTGDTPYAVWLARWGLAPLWLAAALAAALALGWRRKNR